MPSSLDRLNKIGFSAPKKFSKFDLSFTNSLSQNGGEIMPIFAKEVMAGDTFSIESNHVTRMITPAVPVMDNLMMDQYFFFVPMRLCSRDSKDWEAIYGTDKGLITYNEQTASSTGNAIPAFNVESSTYYALSENELANNPQIKYGALAALGYPILSTSSSNQNFINLFKANAYIRIFNDWFRDENLQAEIPLANASVPNDNATFFFWKVLNPTPGVSGVAPQGCLYANRLHDYFTSCLPSPQSGNAVLMPLAGNAPVVPMGSTINYGSNGVYVGNNADPITGLDFSGSLNKAGSGNSLQVGGTADDPVVNGTNLYADLANATGATITALRQAFAIQAILERDMLGGHKRYNELLQAHFNTSPSDSTLQRSQYLASMRSMLSVTQVIQSTPTNSSPLGTTGAFSNTSNSKYLGTFSFNEPGYVIGVSIIRPLNTFAYSVDKTIYRNRRFDYYWPLLANLSEQPVELAELVAKLSKSTLGYQEAWQDYRVSRNEIHGAFVYDQLIKQWTFADFNDDYTGLNEIISYRDTISQTLVSNSTPYQFISNFYFKVIATRPLPMFSIPARLGGYF